MHPSKKLFTSLLCLTGLLLAGCGWHELGDSPAGPNRPAPSARRVELVNLTSRTRAANPSSLSVEQFSTRATQDYQEGKPGRLRRLVARYPDVALEMLRSTDPRLATTPERQAVARAYDRLFVASAEVCGWNRTLNEMAGQTEARQYFNARMRAKGLIEQGRFVLAAKEVASDSADQPPFLRAEALRLRGIALLLNDQPADAATAWRAARDLAAADAAVAAELDLLLSDALRKAGQPAESAAAWGRAASEAVGGRLNDPILWERLMELEPPSAAWPATVAAAFNAVSRPAATTQPAAPNDSRNSESSNCAGLVWYQIGQWRLARNEAAAALLAFARAEAESQSALARGEARIGQARALVAMNQDAPALVILTAVAQLPEPAVSSHATAVIGVVKLQQGRDAEGLSLLQRAVENPDRIRWPEFALAQADLGLAYLTAGHEENGLRLLHDAQDAFTREGRTADLAQCLTNEVAYLRKSGHSERTTVALQRIEQLDASLE